MRDLFRFVTLRPAVRANARRTVPVRGRLAEDLRQARDGEAPRPEMARVALTYAAGPEAVRQLDDLPIGARLQALRSTLEGAGAPQDLAGLQAAIAASFDDSADRVAESADFLAARDRLSDTLLAAKVLSNGRLADLEELAAALRILDLIERAARNDEELNEPGGVAEGLERSLLLPDGLFPIPTAPGTTRLDELRGDDREAEKRVEELRNRIRRLETSVSTLTSVRSADLNASSLAAEPAEPPPPPAEETREGAAASDSRSGLRRQLSISPLALRSEVAAALSEEVTTSLAAHRLDPATAPVPKATEILESELTKATLELLALTSKPAAQVKKLGGKWQNIGFLEHQVYQGAADSFLQSHGHIKPVGIGDLLVVKQQLKRYEPGEVAHIENILKAELKNRQHRRATRTETFVLSERELTTEEERDLQSTERFELQRETSNTVKSDSSLKAGVAVSASYGGMLEVKSSVDYASSTSKQEAAKQASDYSKEVTNRSASKVTERIREQKTVKVIEEFEEKNEHGFDNTAGADHVIGVYQWVDKVYEAQVFNYGVRMLFDMTVPEPAAFYIAAQTREESGGEVLVKPDPFTLDPSQLSPYNYSHYVAKYEATGIAAPPKPYITISKAFDERSPEQANAFATKTAEVPIPDGYQAFNGNAMASFSSWDNEPQGGVTLIVGANIHKIGKNDYSDWYFNLDDEVDTIPVAVKSFKTSTFIATIEINCQRTDRALEEWALKAHAGILQAYLKLLQDYEQKLAAKEAAMEPQILGRNPAANRQLERTELKKSCISVFTEQHYDAFGAIQNSAQGLPETDLALADPQGRYIRFFEQAFEWEQAMYFFYPYFWGRKPYWVSKLALDDVDPVFADFLRAGEARVVVPVRPKFEKAIGHFLETGQIWEGGDLPDLTSPLYLSIIQEIKERDKAAGTEIPQDKPWDVRLPTTLVKLRPDGTLPSWEKDADGNWIPL